MAKGSVRKKGKKWYYRFYVENESGNLVQKEYAGTERQSGLPQGSWIRWWATDKKVSLVFNLRGQKQGKLVDFLI